MWNIKLVKGVPRELQGRRKDGTLFPIELSLGSTVQKGNEFYVATFRDISRKKIFEQIKLSSRYEEEFEELEVSTCIGKKGNPHKYSHTD